MRRLVEVEFIWSRWYVIARHRYEGGEVSDVVIGSMPGEGLAEFDSVEEYEEAV